MLIRKHVDGVTKMHSCVLEDSNNRYWNMVISNVRVLVVSLCLVLEENSVELGFLGIRIPFLPILCLIWSWDRGMC